MPATVAAAIAVGALAPGASADLPARTPEQVLVLAQQGADLDAFSGTVSVRTDLGIPAALLDAAGGEPSGPPAGNERTVRVWRDGDERARVSVASTMGERTIVRDGDEAWAWDSGTATATRLVLPDGAVAPGGAAASGVPPWSAPTDPSTAARWVLDTIGPTTTVTAGEPTTVAGREVYELVLAPTQDGTLVGTAHSEGSGPEAPKAAGSQPQVVGTGWTSVVVVPASVGAADELAAALPAGVARPVSGGQVVTTALLSVLVADDGRVLVGAVTPQVLESAAGG